MAAAAVELAGEIEPPVWLRVLIATRIRSAMTMALAAGASRTHRMALATAAAAAAAATRSTINLVTMASCMWLEEKCDEAGGGGGEVGDKSSVAVAPAQTWTQSQRRCGRGSGRRRPRPSPLSWRPPAALAHTSARRAGPQSSLVCCFGCSCGLLSRSRYAPTHPNDALSAIAPCLKPAIHNRRLSVCLCRLSLP